MSEFAQAEKKYIHAAGLGNPAAMLALWELYSQALIRPQDPRKDADYYLEAAAAENYAPAMIRLALQLLIVAVGDKTAGGTHATDKDGEAKTTVEANVIERAIDLLQRGILAGTELPRDLRETIPADAATDFLKIRARTPLAKVADYKPTNIDAVAYLGELRVMQGDCMSAIQLWSEAAGR
eukprot:scaffold7629_cov191-Pinguiococcus_pyrenoidosus.AAC.1